MDKGMLKLFTAISIEDATFWTRPTAHYTSAPNCQLSMNSLGPPLLICCGFNHSHTDSSLFNRRYHTPAFLACIVHCNVDISNVGGYVEEGATHRVKGTYDRTQSYVQVVYELIRSLSRLFGFVHVHGHDGENSNQRTGRHQLEHHVKDVVRRRVRMRVCLFGVVRVDVGTCARLGVVRGVLPVLSTCQHWRRR